MCRSSFTQREAMHSTRFWERIRPALTSQRWRAQKVTSPVTRQSPSTRVCPYLAQMRQGYFWRLMKKCEDTEIGTLAEHRVNDHVDMRSLCSTTHARVFIRHDYDPSELYKTHIQLHFFRHGSRASYHRTIDDHFGASSDMDHTSAAMADGERSAVKLLVPISSARMLLAQHLTLAWRMDLAKKY